VLAVRIQPGTDKPEAIWLRWGLVPSWAEDVKIGYKLINARLDTVAAKPSFRSAFKHRHCLVLADGFYEWKTTGKAKQPFHIRMRDGRPFGFAGLWEKWEYEGKTIESCTILTTDANATVSPVHNRMPVIVDPLYFQDWLTTASTAGKSREGSDSAAAGYLGPYPAELMTAMAVNSVVNNTRNRGPDCLEPAAAGS
jgi:putative SOS response-associated peptidase YedK